MEGEAFGVLHEVADAFDAEDVCDFVRVEDCCGGGVGQGEGDEARWGEHGGFDVHVRIDEPGGAVAPGGVVDLPGFAFVRCNGGDEPALDVDIGGFGDPSVEDIDHAGVCDRQITGFITAGDGHEFGGDGAGGDVALGVHR